MFEQLEILGEFFEKGGPVVLLIFLVSIFMWLLIIERYWFYFHRYPLLRTKIVKKWKQRHDHTSWYATKIREGFITELSVSLKHNLLPIKTLTSILPLLGLFGTVTAMISVFDVLNVFGTSNAKGMADGISRALLSTAAGLATSIVGIYFGADLKKRAKEQELRVKELLTS